MLKLRWKFLLSISAGVLFVVTAVGLALSFWSFIPRESYWFFWHSKPVPITNWGGRLGLYLSGMLIHTFGAAAYFIVPIFLWLGYWCVMRKSFKKEWERVLSSFCLVANLSALYHAYNFSYFKSVMPGGVVGKYIADSFVHLLDFRSALVLLHVSLIAFLVLTLRSSGAKIVYYASKGIIFCVSKTKYIFIPLYKGVRIVFVWTGRGAKHAAKCTFSLFKAEDLDGTDDSILEFERGESFDDAVKNVHDDDFWGEEGNEDQEFNLQDSIDKELSTIKKVGRKYKLPNKDIFKTLKDGEASAQNEQINEDRARSLEEKLERFGISGKVTAIKPGPVITLFEYQPDMDSKVSKIVALSDDLAMALKAMSIRIIAPIPGTSVVGFEVANADREDVLFSDIIKSDSFSSKEKHLPIVLGRSPVGSDVVVDLADMPHLLIAGSTGSGKSVSLNTMLISLICKLTPKEFKLILIDPKRLEFTSYHDIPHLLFPVVTDPRQAIPVLRWVVKTMEERYEKLADWGVRNIFDYKQMVKRMDQEDKLPFIVVVIDELSDLMMAAGKDVEDLIIRIAQMARAAGIHMVVATQRPSVDVITGLIKVNFPSRISFKVTSRADSRTILDDMGAEKLLGRGDMLFMGPGGTMIERVHGAYVSDTEIDEVSSHVRSQKAVEYLELIEETPDGDDMLTDADQELFEQVLVFLEDIDEVSISLLQRKFKIGYNRSARIIEVLENRGLVIPSESGKSRKVVRQ